MKWGWELRLLRHFGGIGRSRQSRGAEIREVTFCAQVAYLIAIRLELDVHFRPKVIPSSPWEPKVPQMAPRSPKRAKGKAKVTPGRAPWEPEAPQRVPKGSPKSTQGEQNELQRRPKETNKSENYIHVNKIQANSRSTAIQRRTSNINYIVCLLIAYAHAMG